MGEKVSDPRFRGKPAKGGINSLERAAQETDASESFVVVRPDQVLGPPRLECHISDIAKVNDLLLLQAAGIEKSGARL